MLLTKKDRLISCNNGSMSCRNNIGVGSYEWCSVFCQETHLWWEVFWTSWTDVRLSLSFKGLRWFLSPKTGIFILNWISVAMFSVFSPKAEPVNYMQKRNSSRETTHGCNTLQKIVVLIFQGDHHVCDKSILFLNHRNQHGCVEFIKRWWSP